MFRRSIGSVLVVLGVLGLVLCAVGVYYGWRTAQVLTKTADEALQLLLDTLESVDTSLEVATTTLDNTSVTVRALYTTTLTVGETLSSTRPALQGMAALAETQLSESVEATLTALDTLEQTAGVVDRILSALNALGLVQYAPEVPLDQAVAEVAASLGSTPDDLRALGASLQETEESLVGVQYSVMQMSEQLLAIGTNVNRASVAIASYEDVLGRLREQVVNLKSNMHRLIRTIAWGVTILLVWVGISQFALIQWGVSLMRRDRRSVPMSDSSAET